VFYLYNGTRDYLNLTYFNEPNEGELDTMETMSYPDYFNQTRRMMGALGREIPTTMSAFQQLHKSALDTGALSPKIKEIIALAISIRAQCETCITYHVHDALEAGATREEILDALGVTVLMGGAPAIAYSIKALEAMNQFQEKMAEKK
jgi:AhpD family alkylhydroperoxidase